MEKHFILTEEFKINSQGVKLFRIQCIREIPGVSIGDLGGFIEKEENLSGNAWVGQDAEVFGNSEVSGNVKVAGNAQIFGNSKVYGNVKVAGNAQIFGNSKVYGNALVEYNAEVFGDAKIFGNARIFGNAKIFGNARIAENAQISGHARVFEDAAVFGNAWVYENAKISGTVHINGNLEITDEARVSHKNDYCCFQCFGSKGRTTSVFREKGNKIKIICGCFKGTIEEFEEAVEETHGNNQSAKEYKAIINVIKVKFIID